MAEKKDVRRLNRESPASRRLGTDGKKGHGDLHEEIASLVNQLRLANLASANAVYSAAGCAMATTKSKAKTVNALTYTIDGVFKSKGATDDFWTLTGGNLADGKARKYLLLIDASGNASVAASSDASAPADCVLPDPPDSKAVVGVLTIANASGAAFVPATTLLDAAGITATFVDGYRAPVSAPAVTPLV